MRKVIITTILGIIVTGCSVTRNTGRTSAGGGENLFSGNILEDVKNLNITKSGFLIQKAEIEILSSNSNNRFIASIKYETPDRYLVSIKSKTGIEGLRIFISGDSILINDRLNKKIYIANALYLTRKYGLSKSLLPLIFGDIVLARNYEKGLEKCLGNEMDIDCTVNGVRLNYHIDCRERKIIEVKESQTALSESIDIKFKKFIKRENYVVPGIVEIDDRQNNSVIKIKIVKFEIPWKGNMKFIPGKGYELIELE